VHGNVAERDHVLSDALVFQLAIISEVVRHVLLKLLYIPMGAMP
jgi:hypothetical protein